MSPTLTSERDRDILRSFARRIDPSDAGAHNNLGVLYYNKGMYEEAVGAFTRALEVDPKMQVAQRNLEIAYFNTGYYERRVSELRDRLHADPADRTARWELGRAYAAVGDYQDAVAEFTALLTHHPDDLGAIIQLGLAEKSSGDLESALRRFARALQLDPDSPVVNLYIGEVLYNRGLNAEALSALERAIELNPENPDAHYLLGFVLGDMGRHEEARAATKRAIKLNPALSRAQANLSLDKYNEAKYGQLLPERQERRSQQLMAVVDEGHLAHYNLAHAYRQQGYYAEALREYTLALERGEDSSQVIRAMAEVHLLARQPEAALELHDRLLANNQSTPKLWNERGVALHQQGRHAEALDSYRRAVALDDGYAIAWNNLGVGLYHAGESEDAVDALRTALAHEPDFAKAWLNLALLMSKTGRLTLGMEAYRRVLAVEAEHPVAWNGIGLVLNEHGKFEEARNAFGRAIQARPEYAEAHYNLSFALNKLGDYEGALRETKRALELDPYYVPQKFELAIDLEYEDPDIAVAPDLGGVQRVDRMGEAFRFDAGALDNLFGQLAPPAAGAGHAAPAEPTPAPAGAASDYALAADFLAKGLLDRASAEITRAMSHGADQGEGLQLLAEVFERQGLHGEALERYRQARSANGRSPRASMVGEVRALLSLGRAADARPIAEELVAADDADVEALTLAAEARTRSGDARGALALLEQAHRLAPDDAEVLRQAGDAARAAGDANGAINAYREALERDGGLAVARFELARLLAAKRMGKEAERELLAALDSVPTYVEATIELAAVRRRFGDARHALDPLIDLLRRDPYNLDALQALGETLLELERHRDAATAFERVLKFDPRHAGALYYAGVVAADERRFGDALAYWRRAMEAAPESEYARRADRDARHAEAAQRVLRLEGHPAHAH